MQSCKNSLTFRGIPCGGLGWPAVRNCTKRCAENVRCVHSAEHTVNIVICQAVSGTGNGPVGGRQPARPRRGIRWERGYFYEFFHKICPLCPLKSVFWASLGADPGYMSMLSMQFSRAIRPCRSFFLAAGRLIVPVSSWRHSPRPTQTVAGIAADSWESGLRIGLCQH